MATNVFLPGLIADPPSPPSNVNIPGLFTSPVNQPQNNTWAPIGLAEQALRNAQNIVNTQPVSQPVSQPNNDWMTDFLANQFAHNSNGIGATPNSALNQSAYNPNVTGIGVSTNNVASPSTYNSNITGIGVNQNSAPNQYMMWGGMPYTLAGLPLANSNTSTNGNAPTNLFKPSCNQPGYASSAPASPTSLDNNLLSMGLQRGAAVQ